MTGCSAVIDSNSVGLQSDDSTLTAWLSWATRCADQVDPVPGILERCRPAPPKPTVADGQAPATSGSVAEDSNSNIVSLQASVGGPTARTLDRQSLYQQVWSRPVQVVRNPCPTRTTTGRMRFRSSCRLVSQGHYKAHRC